MNIKNILMLVAVMTLAVVFTGCGEYMSQSTTLKTAEIQSDSKVTYNVGDSIDFSRTFVYVTYKLKSGNDLIRPKYDLVSNPDNLKIEVMTFNTKTPTNSTQRKVVIKFTGQGSIKGSATLEYYITVNAI